MQRQLQFVDDEDYQAYAEYLTVDRKTHRAQKPGTRTGAFPDTEMPPEIVEQLDGDEVFRPTFACSDNESALLSDTLGPFYYDNVISDVLGRVKGGKEANVYCCKAHPSTGLDLIAAKIYRPRAHRTLRNDSMYKEGRLMLDEEGKGIVRDARVKRAVANKTGFGREVMTFSWIEHEYDMLETLHADGADVPRPIGHVANAILMEYLGERNAPAPTLNGVQLGSRAEAAEMFERLLWHVERMLIHERVHGDLSPYNVLHWKGRAVVIDFPQAVNAVTNPHAEWMLERDVERLASYFEAYGLRLNGPGIAGDLWNRFWNARL